MGVTFQIRQILAECRTSLTVQGNSHLLDIICRFTAGTKKRRLRASFSVLQLKDELELCVGAITQRMRSRGFALLLTC